MSIISFLILFKVETTPYSSLNDYVPSNASNMIYQ